jgi:hypothetical protein
MFPRRGARATARAWPLALLMVACGPWAAVPLEPIDVDTTGAVSSSSGGSTGEPATCTDLGACFGDEVELAVGLTPVDLRWGDVAGDGIADVVVRGQLAGAPTRVLVGASSEGLSVGAPKADGALGAVLVDVDGDGRDDLVASEGTALAVYDGASGLSVRVALWEIGRRFATLRVLEPAGDGAIRIAGEDREVGALATIELGDAGPVVTAIPYGSDPTRSYSSNGLDIGDLDGDGAKDVVVVVDMYGDGSHLAEVRVWPPGGSSYAATWFSGEGHHQAIADVDGDGADDVLVLEYFGRLHRFASTGPAMIADVDGWTAASANAMAVGDVDGDGIADVVLARHPNDDDPRLDLITGWDEGDPVPYSLAVDHEFDVVGVADVDGDGRGDIVGGSGERGSISVLYARW